MAGNQGDKGDRGSQGDQGNQGVRGKTGAQGATGVQGDAGIQGTTGEKGIRLKGWERLGFMFLIFIMVISTASTALASREAARAAKNTDLIAQCTTPGTKCFDLQRQSEARRTAENKCIIESLIDLPPATERLQRRDEILANYDRCVEDFTRTGVSTTTTTAPVAGTTTK